MKNLKNKLTTAIALGAALFLSAQQAVAINLYTASFDDVDAQGGSIDFDATTGGKLIATDILIDTVINQNNDVLKIVNGKYNFATGAGSYNGTDWSFSGTGSSYSLTGQLADTGGNLLTGEIEILSGIFGDSKLVGNTFNASGTIVLSSALTDFMGIDLSIEDVYMSEFATTTISLDGFTYDPTTGYFNTTNQNAQAVAAVITIDNGNSPVPSGGTTATFLILGVSCLGFSRKLFSSNS